MRTQKDHGQRPRILVKSIANKEATAGPTRSYVKSIVVGIKSSVSSPCDESEGTNPSQSNGGLLLGRSICDVVLVNMATTEDMVGLSQGVSWTQRSPIWMHRVSSDKSSGSESESGTIVVSTSSAIMFVSHNPQACKRRFANYRNTMCR